MNKSELSERISLLLNKYEDDLFFGEEIQVLHNRINSITSSIVAVGQFSVGKSELLNALLGEKLLASRRMESTKVTTRIHKCMDDEMRKIVLHYKNGEKKELAITDISILDQYTTFQGSGEEEELEFVDVYWPLQFLDNQLLLVDTPGANSLTEDAFIVTEKELVKASSVLYLFNGQKGIDQIDLSLLKNLMNRRKKVFIVATHVDGLTDEELKSVISSVQDKLEQEIDDSKSIKIYPVSSTEALQAKQTGDSSLLERSNIQELEEALMKYVNNQEYLASEIESIHYDLEVLETNILEAEEDEMEENEEIERQKQLRVQRKRLLLNREYDLVREYGLELLGYREKSVLQVIEDLRLEVTQNNQEYKKEVLQSFRDLRKRLMQDIRMNLSSSNDLKREYTQYNKKMNRRYEEILGNFKEITTKLYERVAKTIEEEDSLFIENLEAGKWSVELNWPEFIQEIKEVIFRKQNIESDDSLFTNYEQERKEIEEECSKNQKKLVQITLDEKSIEKGNQEILQDLKEDYNRDVQNIGQRPEPREERIKKGILFWKKEVVVGYDYTASDHWEKKMEALSENYERAVEEKLNEFDTIQREIKEIKQNVLNEIDKSIMELEDLEDKLFDDLMAVIDNQQKAAKNFYRQLEDEIMALWKIQENHMMQQFNYHTTNIEKRFIRFVEQALQEELQLIR
ncbi:dynamin family protein [Bacillus cereus group sp. BY6-1LC]|uniref:dynamin family protein n=1 Tax=Bacillus cereus group sp. BY6-1LC TaxID=3018077 RepID=UPI0022DF1B5D|nr:dynamin family protein [Bacillus cereus group sp. BY6-1LC]MDA1800401.1 dynamin family protein [Bacillus cereus group sp. BY6-1LC]